jgi:hypothetical protein
VVQTAREALAALRAVAGAAAHNAEGKPGQRASPRATIELIAMIADAFEAQGGVVRKSGGVAFEGVVVHVVPPLLKAAGRHARATYHDLITEALRDRR